MTTTEQEDLPVTRAIRVAMLATEFLDLLPPAEGENASVAPMPVYFLIGHALELAFKALLILEGITDQALRAIGHDLESARRQLSERHESLVSGIVAATSVQLTPIYASKGFEYVSPGFGQVPFYTEVREPVIAGVWSIRRFVENEVRTGRHIQGSE